MIKKDILGSATILVALLASISYSLGAPGSALYFTLFFAKLLVDYSKA